MWVAISGLIPQYEKITIILKCKFKRIEKNNKQKKEINLYLPLTYEQSYFYLM